MDSIGTPALWAAFVVIVVTALGIDLGLLSRDPKPMSKRAAIAWTSLWVSLAMGFALAIYIVGAKRGTHEPAMEFLAAYLIEYSLSVDNLFVFLLLFSAFRVPLAYQHRVLYWGIFGAVVLRAIFIFVGTALLQRFHFLIYVFGAFLLYTGAKLLVPSSVEEGGDVGDNKVVKLARRFIKVSNSYDGAKFFTVENGVRVATPLLLVLVSVELSDVVFALDSIPAVFGVSLDPFIVFTSNIFAILGLRSLFFLLSGVLWGLRFLKPALGVVLAFVGGKMCLPLVHLVLESMSVDAKWLPHHVATPVSLAIVGGALGLGILASVLFPARKPELDEIPLEAPPHIDGAGDGGKPKSKG